MVGLLKRETKMIRTIASQNIYTDIFEYIHRISKKVRLFFYVKPENQAKKIKRKQKKTDELEITEYGTIKSLLNDLDITFKDIKKITPKKNDHQKAVKRYGAYICSFDSTEDELLCDGLENFKGYGFPTYLVLSISPNKITKKESKDGSRYLNQFFTGIKQNTYMPPFDRKGCVYYECCNVIIFRGKPVELYYYIEINKKTGHLNPLPFPKEKTSRITTKARGKKGQSNRGRVIHTHGWEYPKYMAQRQIGDGSPTDSETKDSMIKTFSMMYNLTMRRELGINIIIKKGKNRCTVNVPTGRWKYFFKDRLKIKTPKGNTKPIFHAVSAHYRHVKNKVSTVKTHYKGLRSFFWNGYSIKIIMPGMHGVAQASMGLTGYTKKEAEKKWGENVETVSLGSKEISGAVNAMFEGYDSMIESMGEDKH